MQFVPAAARPEIVFTAWKLNYTKKMQYIKDMFVLIHFKK